MSLLIDFYRQSEEYFFTNIALQSTVLEESAHAYMTGEAELNFLYLTKNTNDLDSILTQGKQFFDQGAFSFELITPQQLWLPYMEDVLRFHHYVYQSESASMVIDLDHFSFDQSANIAPDTVIRENNTQLNEWMMPFVGAFESTYEKCMMYAALHKDALQKHINLQHFSVYKQEQPVSSITLSLNNGLARIDDMGTQPEFQGNGYASALLRYVLAIAKRKGAHYCFLEASDSGLGVYKKLGFEILLKNNVYSRKVMSADMGVRIPCS